MKASYIILASCDEVVWTGSHWESATDNGWLGRAARWTSLAAASNQIMRIVLSKPDMRVAKYVPVRTRKRRDADRVPRRR